MSDVCQVPFSDGHPVAEPCDARGVITCSRPADVVRLQHVLRLPRRREIVQRSSADSIEATVYVFSINVMVMIIRKHARHAQACTCVGT